VPGQPPANVEYRRRKERTFRTTLLFSAVLRAHRKPNKRRIIYSLEFWDMGKGELVEITVR